MQNHIGNGLGISMLSLYCSGREDRDCLVRRKPEFCDPGLDRDKYPEHIGMLVNLVAYPGIVTVSADAGHITILQEGLVIIPVAAAEEA